MKNMLPLRLIRILKHTVSQIQNNHTNNLVDLVLFELHHYLSLKLSYYVKADKSIKVQNSDFKLLE